jgi:dTDP-4-amino-4,6-dideoxygalactose transaminase
MTTNINPRLLEIVGEAPTRPGPFQATPIVGERDAGYVRAYLNTGSWQAGGGRAGIECRPGVGISPSMVRESLGAENAYLAAEFAALHAPGQKVNVVPVTNGTRAISLALTAISSWADALNLRPHRPGDEVIVPALTFAATASAVWDRGLIPVLVDVSPDILCIGPEQVKAAITDRTVAVIPVHLYGAMAEVGAIREVCDPLGIGVIEDCAHAHGARIHGKAAGTTGHLGTFSLQGSKVLTAGEGGLVIATDTRLADQVVSLCNCGRPAGDARPVQGSNDRLAGVLAAVARSQLRVFDEQRTQRLMRWKQFDGVVAGLSQDYGLSVLPRQPGVNPPPTYKKLVRVDLTKWGGVSLDMLMTVLSASLQCEVTALYDPLNDSDFWSPLSDFARCPDEWRDRLDPSQYDAPVALAARRGTIAIEHAAFLDDGFSESFAAAVEWAYDNAARLTEPEPVGSPR